MGFYKKIFNNSMRLAGAEEGASFLMPPEETSTKIGFQLYEALDLICEGPIFGLVDQRGRKLGKFAEFATDSATNPVNQSTFTDADVDEFKVANTNGGTARVFFPLQKALKESDVTLSYGTPDPKVEIEFTASGISGATYTVRMVADTGSTTQRSVESKSVVNGDNTIVLTLNGETKAVMFQVSNNATLTVKNFGIRRFGQDQRAIKNFDKNKNSLGSTLKGIDKGVYFDNVPLRDELNEPQVGKYSVQQKLGYRLQGAHDFEFAKRPSKLKILGIPIKGPYDMGGQRTLEKSQLSSLLFEEVVSLDSDGDPDTDLTEAAVITELAGGQLGPTVSGGGRNSGRQGATYNIVGDNVIQVFAAQLDAISSMGRDTDKRGYRPRFFRITAITDDPQIINLVKSMIPQGGRLKAEAINIKLFDLNGEASKLNFRQPSPTEQIQRNFTSAQAFIFSEASDNTDGSLTIKGLAALTFKDLSVEGESRPQAIPNNDEAIPNLPSALTSQNKQSDDYAGLIQISAAGGGFVGGSAARLGIGSSDIRLESNDADAVERDFVNWQNFVPLEKLPKPFRYVNYDSNIDELTVNLQIDRLNDTKSKSTKEENEAGTSNLGSMLPSSVTVKVTVGKVDKDGITTQQNADFDVRAGTTVTKGDGDGLIKVEGVIVRPYTFSLENIKLPKLEEGDLNNFMIIEKVEYETLSNLISRDIGVATISEITDVQFRYPYSASIATSIDSRYYPTVPERTFRAKGKLVLIPSNYNPIDPSGVDRRFSTDKSTRGNLIYDGPWDGSFKFGWTDNPAWIYYDLLINSRYGLGSYIRDLNIIDKWSLFEIGQYCDAVTVNDGSRTSKVSGEGIFVGLDDGNGGLEPRFSCNMLFKEQQNAFDALNNLAKSFGAMSFYDNSTMSLRVDQPHFYTDFNRDEAFEATVSNSGVGPVGTGFLEPPKELKFPPHLFFNNSNVIDGVFNYSDTDRTQKLSAIEVSFLDKSTNYTQQTEYVENGELIKENGLNITQVPAIGATSRSQAHRFAKNALFESARATETVSFKAGFEALLLTPGDIIQVNDELKDFTKSYGTILATSGEEIYFDPDSAEVVTSTISSGIGPRAILVQPALGSTQLEKLGTGNIHIYNPIGQSGTNEFYKTTSASTDTKSGYRAIHEPQIISLKLKEGGNGVTYNEVDDGVLFHIDVSGIYKQAGSAQNKLLATQWFAESKEGTRSRKNANFIGGAPYSIDVSGVKNKYYRVLSIVEDDEVGYNVSALIHHTGKFKFVEENLSFDTTPDIFQPDLKLEDLGPVSAPSSPTFVVENFSSNADGTLNLPVKISRSFSATNPKTTFRVTLEKPNLDTIEVEAEQTGAVTTVNFNADTEIIDQIGDHNISILTEVDRTPNPIKLRSTTAATGSFNAGTGDFGINTATDSFIEYQNISLITDLDTTYSQVNDIGTGTNSFFKNDDSINATFEVEFQNIFGQSGAGVLDQVLEQRIDILNATGATVARNFKIIGGKETRIEITHTGLQDAFGVGSGQFKNLLSVPNGLKFQGGFFQFTGFNRISNVIKPNFIPFETPTGFYEKNPVVLIQQLADGFYRNVNGLVRREQPIARLKTETSGFLVANSNLHPTKYCFFASPTGIFNVNGSVIQVGSGTMTNGQADFEQVTFPQAFTSTPKVVVQNLNSARTGDRAVQGIELLPELSPFGTTTTSHVSTTGFRFGSFNESGKANQSTGFFGYVATDINTFNIFDSLTSINSINMATTRLTGTGYKMTTNDGTETGTSILSNLNKSNFNRSRFNNQQQMTFIQNTGLEHTGEHFVLHRIGTENFVISHPMQTGMPRASGFRTTANNSGNKISLEFISGIGSVGQPRRLPQFKITSGDIAILSRGNGNEFVGERSVGPYTNVFKPDIRIKSLTIVDPGANLPNHPTGINITVSHPAFTVPTGIVLGSGVNNGILTPTGRDRLFVNGFTGSDSFFNGIYEQGFNTGFAKSSYRQIQGTDGLPANRGTIDLFDVAAGTEDDISIIDYEWGIVDGDTTTSPTVTSENTTRNDTNPKILQPYEFGWKRIGHQINSTGISFTKIPRNIDGGSGSGQLINIQANIVSGSVQDVNVINSGVNRFRPSIEYLFSEGTQGFHKNWTVNVSGGGSPGILGAPALTGNVHLATMVNVPSNATNQMFILDNIFSGKLDDDGAQILPNVNKSGFAFFLSGISGNPFLHVDGTDYKLSDTKINDGENHFIEAHFNREPAGQDEIIGYVDGNSGNLHSLNQHPNTINYMFSGSMCLFNNSGRHHTATNPSFAFNSGLIIDAIGLFTGRERFGSLNSPHTGSLYKAQYKTGLRSFIDLHSTGTKTFMLTTFTGSTFKNGISGGRGYDAIKHGNFEKTDIISRRIDNFNLDIIQIGNTGLT